MGTDFLSNLLTNFQSTFFDKAVTNLLPIAKTLFFSLAVIDLVLVTLMNLGDPDTLKKLGYNVLKYAAIFWVLLNFNYLVTTVFNSCVAIGGYAINGAPLTSEEVSHYPAEIIDKGVEYWSKVAFELPTPSFGFSLNIIGTIKKCVTALLTYPAKLTLHFSVATLILICFGLMAIELFVTLMEFYICAGVSVILIPFAVNKHTAFVAQKALNALIGFGIKVIFVVLVVSVAKEQISKWMSSSNSFEGLFYMLFGVAGLTFLAWQVPKIAMGFMSGSPSQGAAGVMAAGAQVVGAFTGTAKMAMAAGSKLATMAGTKSSGAVLSGGGGTRPGGIAQSVNPNTLGALSRNGGSTQSNVTGGLPYNPNSLAWESKGGSETGDNEGNAHNSLAAVKGFENNDGSSSRLRKDGQNDDRP